MCVRDDDLFDVEPPRREAVESTGEQTMETQRERRSRTGALREIAEQLREIGRRLDRLDYTFWARAAWSLAKTVQKEADQRWACEGTLPDGSSPA